LVLGLWWYVFDCVPLIRVVPYCTECMASVHKNISMAAHNHFCPFVPDEHLLRSCQGTAKDSACSAVATCYCRSCSRPFCDSCFVLFHEGNTFRSLHNNHVESLDVPPMEVLLTQLLEKARDLYDAERSTKSRCAVASSSEITGVSDVVKGTEPAEKRRKDTYGVKQAEHKQRDLERRETIRATKDLLQTAVIDHKELLKLYKARLKIDAFARGLKLEDIMDDDDDDNSLASSTSSTSAASSASSSSASSALSASSASSSTTTTTTTTTSSKTS